MLLPVGLLALAACTTESPGAAVTDDVSATPTVAETFVWPEANAARAAGEAPAFPDQLQGWELQGEWTDPVRVFSGDEGAESAWTTVSGPDFEEFPATMNGCDSRQFLVRWRAVKGDVELGARWVRGAQALGTYGLEGTEGGEHTGSAGWMVLDGCQVPQMQLASIDDGSTLADVAVEVQEWAVAP